MSASRPVFLALSPKTPTPLDLLNLLPSAAENFQKSGGKIRHLPIVYLACLLGFLSILLIEKVVHAIAEAGHEKVEHVEHHAGTPHHLHNHHIPVGCKSRYASCVLILAMSVDTFFEGIAFGIQSSLKQTVFFLVIIFLHKISEAFAVGVSLVKADLPREKWVKLVLLYALGIPFGIVAGILLQKASAIASLISSVFVAFAAGTFIYIAVLEIIAEELSHCDYLWRKFSLLVLGVLVVCGITVIDVGLTNNPFDI